MRNEPNSTTHTLYSALMLSSFQHLWTHQVLRCLHTFKQKFELFISISLGSSARHLYTVVRFLKPVGESNLETLVMTKNFITT